MRTPEAVLIVTVLASTLGLGAGCMGRAEGPSTDVAGVSLVRVGLSFTRGQASEARFGAEAHFVRLRGTDTPWVAAVLGLPGDEAIPLDSCRLVDRARELSRELDRAFNNDAKSTVELLDAGRLSARGPSGQVALQAWHYPQLTPYASGVVYGADETRSLALEPGATYSVASEGGEDVGAFIGQVQAPRAFPLLEPLAWPDSGNLSVRWSTSGAGASAEPLVLSIGFQDGIGARELRCRLRDDGAFQIDRSIFPAGAPAGQSGAGEIVASRFRRASFFAPGVGRGEMVVELRDTRSLNATDDAREPAASR